jgi:hypothetical protein
METARGISFYCSEWSLDRPQALTLRHRRPAVSEANSTQASHYQIFRKTVFCATINSHKHVLFVCRIRHSFRISGSFQTHVLNVQCSESASSVLRGSRIPNKQTLTKLIEENY